MMTAFELLSSYIKLRSILPSLYPAKLPTKTTQHNPCHLPLMYLPRRFFPSSDRSRKT